MTAKYGPLTGKRIVVIGGASGIGFAIAQLAHQAGGDVVIASYRSETVERALSRLDGASGKVIDVRREDDVARSFSELGAIDHVAFTAGDWGVPADGRIRQSRHPSRS